MKQKSLVAGTLAVLLLAGAIHFGSRRTMRPAVAGSQAPTPPAAPATGPARAPALARPLPKLAESQEALWRRAPAEPAFAAFAEWTRRHAAASSAAARAALEDEGADLARARLAAMADLIVANPRRALELAVPDSVRRAMPEAVRAFLEEPVNTRGEYQVVCVMPMLGGKLEGDGTIRSARIGGEAHRVFTFDEALAYLTRTNAPLNGLAVPAALRPDLLADPTGLKPKKLLALSPNPARLLDESEAGAGQVSVQLGGEVRTFATMAQATEWADAAVAAAGLDAVQYDAPTAASSWTEGRKRFLLLRVDFPDYTGDAGLNTNTALSVMSSLSNLMAQMSYGKLIVAAVGDGSDITPVMRMTNNTAAYDNGGLSVLYPEARATAKNTYGYDLNKYDVTFVCTASRPSYGYAGLGYVGAAGFHLANGYWWYDTSCHEYGHNLGLGHANWWDTGGKSSVGAGSSEEYGDPFDVMGGSHSDSHYSSYHKSVLNWIPGSDNLTVSGSGRYRLQAHDNPSAPIGVRALHISRSTSGGGPGGDYWLEVRQAHTDHKAMMNGVGIHANALLLDMTPGSSDGKEDHPLTIGRTFSDWLNFVHITPVSKGHTHPESIDVVVNLGSFPTNQAPALIVTADPTQATANQTIRFVAQAADPNGDELAYSWDFGDGDFSTDNQPTNSHVFTSAGEYCVACTVTDMKGGTARDSVVVRVGSPATYAISGRVLDTNNVPVSGVKVFVDSSHYCFSESDGTYALTRLGAGSYNVDATEPTYGTNSFVHPFFSNPITVGPSATNADLIMLGSSLNLHLPIVARNSTWKYLDNGSDQGTSWTAPTFDDSGWSSGAGILGYGQGNEATVISYGPDADNKHTTYYFRKTFTVTNLAIYTNLLLEVLRDDGVIVYLNGAEVFRDNMPTSGAITYRTFASDAVEPDSYQQKALPMSALHVGTNVLAAEVHQADLTSSDVNFDLALSGLNVASVSTLREAYVTQPANNQAFASPTNLTISAVAQSGLGPASLVRFYADGAKIGEDAAAPFSLVWTNPANGPHSLTIIATLGGVTLTSAPVRITVSAPTPPPPAPVSLTLLATGSVWRYYASNAAPAGAWANLGYNDAAWPSGAAQLGYGDGDEATVVPYGGNANNKWITSYYRRAFVVNDPAAVTNLTLQLKRDDGAVVYLNGTEAIRDLLPAGAITWSTPATNAADDGAAFVTFDLDPRLLCAGSNQVAVEIHQTSVTSTDMSFDLGLFATASTNRARGVWMAAPTNGASVQLPANVTLAAQAVAGGVLGVKKVEFFAEGIKLGEDWTSPFSLTWSNSPGGVFNLTAVATDSAGGAVTSAPVQVTFLSPRPGEALISFGDVWKYLDDGTKQGTNWISATFNDRSWLAGPAKLGYGGDGEITTVSREASNGGKSITTYFRKTFNVPNPAAYTGLLLRLVRDDGAAVYLNGKEMYRSNLLPSAPVTFNSLALTTVNAPEETTPLDVELGATNLVAGANLMAVEIHQASADSSDLGFDLALLGVRPTNLTAGVYLTSPANGTHFNAPAKVPLSAYAAAGGTVRLVEYFEGTNKIGQATLSPFELAWTNAAEGAHALTARATYGAGLTMTSAPVAVVVGPAPPPIAPVSVTLIPALSEWRFWDNVAEVSEGWSEPAFDDRAWPSGPGRFGWGFDGERTELTAGRITHYFRRWFTAPEPGVLTDLLFQLARDDGAVVYLNGKEVFRSNMAAGAITANTLASTTVNPPDETTYFETGIATIGSGLVAGSNLVAVELHQGSATSSDAGFDLQLIGSGTSEGRVYFSAPASGSSFSVLDTVHLEAGAWSGSNAPIQLLDFFVDEVWLARKEGAPYRHDWSNLPPGNHTLTARATDSRGAVLTSAPVSITITLPPVRTTLIPSNAVWRYLDDGSNRGTNWAQPSFNDATWKSGMAELGYGDGGEATVVSYGPSASSRYITTYFRKSFVAPAGVIISNLTFQLVRDDGAVVWLNGHELYRSNMDTNAAVLGYQSHALAGVSGTDEQAFLPTVTSSAWLVPGTNVVAVEIHQADAGSSDISFNLELVGQGYTNSAARATLAAQHDPAGLRMWWPANAYGYRLYATSQPLGPASAWTPVTVPPTMTNGQNTVVLPTGGGAQFFRLGTP